MRATLGVSPEGCLGPNPYHPSPKITNISLGQISTPLLLNICLLPLINLFLSHLLTPTTRTLPPCRQHHSTPLIKIHLMPLTGRDNPLLCHFFGRNDAKAGTPILWPPHAKSWLIGKDWCWEGLGAGGEGDDRGWDGWMASLTRWTWVLVNSGSWCWTGRPGMLRFMGLQRVGHDWANWLNWTNASNRTR